MRSAVAMIRPPSLGAWLDAVSTSPVPDAPAALADLVVPLSGGLQVGAALGLGGDVAVAMLADALAGASSQWARRIQRAVVRRSPDPAAWARCLLSPGCIPAALLARLDDLNALCAWLPEARPEIQARLQRALISLMLRPAVAVPDLAASIQAAQQRAPLDLSGAGEACWEVQRSGFLGHPTLVGDLFTPLLLAEAAADAGYDVVPLVSAVLARRAGEGIRYYRGCPEMPHDADDAALLTLIARRMPPGVVPPPLLAEAGAVLSEATQGGLHTWVVLGEGPTNWLGPRCIGVAARVVRATGVGMERLAQAQDADGGWTALHYPSRIIATGLALRALPPESDAAAAGRAFLQAAQDADGSVGESALSTAEALRAGALSGAEALEAVAYLLRQQRWDGRWPEAPLFLCPHPGNTMQPFGAAPLSTATVLAALAGVCAGDFSGRGGDAV